MGGLAGRSDVFGICPSLANIAKPCCVIKSFVPYALTCFLRGRGKDDIPAKFLIFFLSCLKRVDVLTVGFKFIDQTGSLFYSLKIEEEKMLKVVAL